MFTEWQKKKIEHIVEYRNSLPRTKEELSWRYAIWKEDKVIGLKNIDGKISDTLKAF